MKTRTLTKRPGNAVGASCAMAPRGPWARRFGGQCAELPHMQAPPGVPGRGECWAAQLVSRNPIL